MGVPGYFSWIRRKFPWQVKKVKSKGNKKHIDCLYIDVNGICYQYARDEHNCNYLLNPQSLDSIIKQVIDHIDSIIELIQPQLQVYLMLDGPCPRAKMNQQRQRRFHAQSNHVQLKEALQKNGFDVKQETVPNNSIAPGSPFMFELNQQIRRYIETRIALSNEEVIADDIEGEKKKHQINYRKLQFILSDSNCPGEGEHKILEVIRKHSNLQLTHCIVGADADLLLLSLATIGKRILILRENAKFRGDKGDMDQEMQKLGEQIEREKQEREKQEGGEDVEKKKDKQYDLVDINGLKRVLLEKYKKMFDNKQVMNLKYNPMNIMDDFVFLSLFAGNDFLPRQNYMQIKNEKKTEHILDMLIDKYDAYLANATTYLSDRGCIHFVQILEFFKLIASIEPQFTKVNVFNTLQVQVDGNQAIDQSDINQKQVNNNADLIDYSFKEQDLQLLQKHSLAEENEIAKDLVSSESDEEQKEEKTKTSNGNHNQNGSYKQKDQSTSSSEEQKKPVFQENNEIADILNDQQNGKEIYLKEKLEVHSQQEYDQIIIKYLEGFQFTLLYYFRGIEKASWNYFYPHFYAPLTQDIVEFIERNPTFEVKFVKTQPFQPYKQLLAILHPDNNELLPVEFRGLFKKYLLPYCPEKLDIDKYGATMDHMQIIKLPFIDLSIIEQAYEEGIAALETSTNDYDKNRNVWSQDILFQYDKDAKIDIPVFNKLFHESQIENAAVFELQFNHLDPILPEKLTNLTVDLESKDALKLKNESNQKHKKVDNSDNPAQDEKKKSKPHRRRDNKNEEQKQDQNQIVEQKKVNENNEECAEKEIQKESEDINQHQHNQHHNHNNINHHDNHDSNDTSQQII